MRKAVRAILRVPPPAIDAAQARAIAKRECARRRWPWVEPVSVRERLRDYRVWTNARARGGNVEVIVDAATGEVERAWMGPR